jgi:hypothetical protein
VEIGVWALLLEGRGDGAFPEDLPDDGAVPEDPPDAFDI